MLLPKLYLKRHHRLLSPWELFIRPNLEPSKQPGPGYATKGEAEKVLQDLWELPAEDLAACHIYKAEFRYPYPGRWDFTEVDVDDETQFLVDVTGKPYASQIELMQVPTEFAEGDFKLDIRIAPRTCVIIDSEIDLETKKPTRYKPNFPTEEDGLLGETSPTEAAADVEP